MDQSKYLEIMRDALALQKEGSQAMYEALTYTGIEIQELLILLMALCEMFHRGSTSMSCFQYIFEYQMIFLNI